VRFRSLLWMGLAWLGALSIDMAHGAAIPEPTEGASPAAPSPQFPKVDPLDGLAGPPSSQFT
jgi:hypothetical protein